MKRTCVMGIDNGVTGSITVLYADGTFTYVKMPTFKQRNYTKVTSWLHRVNFVKLRAFLDNLTTTNEVVLAVMERPMVNPGRFAASASALRCLEATQIALELSGIPYAFIDSKAWQKELLPKGLKGSEELKKASDALAKKKYPMYNFKDGEGDSTHIAEYAKKHFTEEKQNGGTSEENSSPD